MQTLEELKLELRLFERQLKKPTISTGHAIQYSKWIEEIKAEIRMAEREGMSA